MTAVIVSQALCDFDTRRLRRTLTYLLTHNGLMETETGNWTSLKSYLYSVSFATEYKDGVA